MLLQIDKERYGKYAETGIYVRARMDNAWYSTDIANLTKESLLEWLRDPEASSRLVSRAEAIVLLMLGHKPQV